MARRIPGFSSRYDAGICTLVLAGLLALCAIPVPSLAQTAAPTPVVPAPTAPAVPAPEAAKPADPIKPDETAKPPEAPKPATDGAGGEMREYAARPVLRIKGQSTWDDGFAALKKAITALEDEAKRLNLPYLGPPMAHFIDSDDLGFTYEAMLPLGAAPPAGIVYGQGFEATVSPSGRAVIFTHEGSYDEIDTAYEALTAWLDDKNLVSTGKFLEEYEFIPEKSDETSMKLKIVVFLK